MAGAAVQFDDEYTALLGTKLPKNRMVPPMCTLGVVMAKTNTSDWLNDTTPIEYLPPTLNWTADGWVTPVDDQVTMILDFFQMAVAQSI